MKPASKQYYKVPGCIWSSTESGIHFAWFYSIESFDRYIKDYYFSVVPFLIVNPPSQFRYSFEYTNNKTQI